MPYHGKKKGPLRGYRRGSTKVLTEEERIRREAARLAGANNTSKGRNVGRTGQPVDPLPGLLSGSQAGYKSLPSAADAQAAAAYRAAQQQGVPPVVAGRPDVPAGDLTNASAPPPAVTPEQQAAFDAVNAQVAAENARNDQIQAEKDAGLSSFGTGNIYTDPNYVPPTPSADHPSASPQAGQDIPRDPGYHVTLDQRYTDMNENTLTWLANSGNLEEAQLASSELAARAKDKSDATTAELQEKVDAGLPVTENELKTAENINEASGFWTNVNTQKEDDIAEQEALAAADRKAKTDAQAAAAAEEAARLADLGVVPKPDQIVDNASPHTQEPLEVPAPVTAADTQAELDAAAGTSGETQWADPEPDTDQVSPGVSVPVGDGGSMTGTDNGGVSVDDGQGNQSIFSGDQVEAVKGVLKDFFGLETGDLKRAIGGYLLSRAAGASHQGAMTYAGQTTYRGIERRENQEIREKERDELWARQDEKEAARIARADRIRAEDAALSASKSDRNFMEANFGTYTPESIKAYLEGGRNDLTLLEPIDKPATTNLTGDTKAVQVEGVPGLGKIDFYEEDIEGVGKVYTANIPVEGDDGTVTYQKMTEQQLRTYIAEQGGDAIKYDPNKHSQSGKAQSVLDFTNSMSNEVNTVFKGSGFESEAPLAAANLASYLQDTLKIDFTNPDEVLAAQPIYLQAIEDMKDDLESGRVKDVNNAAPYVKRSVLSSAALGPGQTWLTQNGRATVDATKVNGIYSSLQNIAPRKNDLKSIKNDFLTLRRTYDALKSSGELGKISVNRKTENEFYVWLKDTLADKEAASAILGRDV